MQLRIAMAGCVTTRDRRGYFYHRVLEWWLQNQQQCLGRLVSRLDRHQ
jgi:hypothetical protein